MVMKYLFIRLRLSLIGCYIWNYRTSIQYHASTIQLTSLLYFHYTNLSNKKDLRNTKTKYATEKDAIEEWCRRREHHAYADWRKYQLTWLKSHAALFFFSFLPLDVWTSHLAASMGFHHFYIHFSPSFKVTRRPALHSSSFSYFFSSTLILRASIYLPSYACRWCLIEI